MTGHLTGTTGDIRERRAECVEFIARLAEQRLVDAKTITQIRRALGSELATLVVSVAALQPKARKKFGPGVWWVTERSLQQATPWQVARLKSSWFGDRETYDLCCGVGGDAMQLAMRGPVVAVDSDATLVEMAAANFAQSEAESDKVRARCGDVTMIRIPSQAAVHIDPDRRAGDRRAGDRRAGDRQAGGGRRSSQPDHYRPAWSDILRIIASVEHTVVKLAPAAKIDISDVPGSHRCWISLGGSVREQSLLSGSALQSLWSGSALQSLWSGSAPGTASSQLPRSGLQPGQRSAVSLSSDGSASWFAPSMDDFETPRADVCAKPQEVLIDPDPAIRAAGLTETFAHQNSLAILGSPSGYLTCQESTPLLSSDTMMAVTGRVIWSGSCDDRKLRKELRCRGVYPAVIKVRGTDHKPDVLAKRYRKCGDQPVTLWIGRAGDGVFATITQPLNR